MRDDSGSAHPAAVSSSEPRAIGRADYRFAEFGTAVLMALLSYLGAYPPSGEHFLAWLTVPGFALGSFHFLKRAFDSRPRIVLTEDGIIDRTSFYGGELLIPWAQVRDVRASRLYGGLQVEVTDLNELMESAGPGRRMALNSWRLFGKRTVTLGTTLLGVGKGELRMRIKTARDHYERVTMGLSGEAPGLAPPDEGL